MQEAATFLGPQNRTQGRCGVYRGGREEVSKGGSHTGWCRNIVSTVLWRRDRPVIQSQFIEVNDLNMGRLFQKSEYK